MDQADLADQTIIRLNESAGISWEEAANNAVITPDDTESPDAPPGDGAPICRTCEQPILLEPGHRGRKPRYHPDCRPSATKGKGGGPGLGTSRKGSRTRAEREADEIAERLRKNLALGAMFVSFVDPFDGGAILAGSKPLSASVSDVLAANERFRKFFVAQKSASGWAGLVVWTLAIVLPILAHHGAIPGEIKRKGQPPISIAEILEKLPQTLTALEKRMASAEADMAATLLGTPDDVGATS